MSSNNSNIKMFGKNYLLEKLPDQTETASGIILADATIKNEHFFTITDRGEDATSAEIGMTVIINPWIGDKVKVGDKDYVIAPEHAILGIVNQV